MADDPLSEVLQRLDQANKVISKLDEAIKPAAFDLIKGLILGDPSPSEGQQQPKGSERKAKVETPAGEGASDFDLIREFVAGQEGKLPSDNVYSIVAWLYDQYGTEIFSSTEVRQLADDAGITIPARLDMTFKGMSKDGKALVQNTSKGRYRVTVPGEVLLKEKFGVAKGTRKRIVAEK